MGSATWQEHWENALSENSFIRALAELTREALAEQGATEDLAALDSKPFRAATEDGSTWYLLVEGRDMPARFNETTIKKRAGLPTGTERPN